MTEHERELYDLVWSLKAEISALKELIFRINPELAHEFERSAAKAPGDAAVSEGGAAG